MNGNLFEKCNYINGKIHGVYEKYYDNGQLKQITNYDNGTIINN
jgi:antitoxin component YwqK of YwqJK toxin-antitoxin module